MTTLDIFKEVMQEGMEITKYKELNNKYKITLSYNGMSASCELNKLCTPGNEKSLCMAAIDTAMSSMYLNAGNYEEAKTWLEGEKWKIIDNQEVRKVKDLRSRLVQAIFDYGNSESANNFDAEDIADYLMEVIDELKVE